MTRRAKVMFVATVAAFTALAGVASASYHEIKIREVHASMLANTDDYVELQMYSDGQNLVSGKYVTTYSNAGALMSTTQLSGNVAIGKSQATILVGASPVVSGVAADFINASLDVVTGGGAVCYIDTLVPLKGIDCVSYDPGSFNAGGITGGNPSPIGSPAPALLAGQSLVRSIARNCATRLEAGDDTDNSAADFAIGTPSPRNNASPITETTCPEPSCPNATKTGTEGNDVIRGTKKKDVIDGLGGDDTISGLNGKDVVCGNLGNDTVKGGNAKDKLFGGAGDDTLLGGNGKDLMDGGDGTDTCNGGRGKDKAVNCEAGTDVKKGKKGKGPKGPKY